MKKKATIIKLLKRGFLTLTILSLWPALTLLYIISSDISFSILTYNHSRSNFSQITDKPLYKGDKIIGSFQAKDNNLGIVSVRFAYEQRVPYRNEDQFLFRIKEQGARDWYYVNTYRSGLIYDVPFFPFGFPLIAQSKDKTYVFEIESLKGTKQNALSIHPREPILASKYQVSKAELMQDKGQLVLYVVKKFINTFSSVDGIFISTVYLSLSIFLTIFFLGNESKRGKKLIQKFQGLSSKHRNIITKATIFVILSLQSINIFILQFTDALMYVSLTGLYIFALFLNKKDESISFVLGVGLLVLSPILFYTTSVFMAEYVASWAFIFLVIGTFQSILHKKKR